MLQLLTTQALLPEEAVAAEAVVAGMRLQIPAHTPQHSLRPTALEPSTEPDWPHAAVLSVPMCCGANSVGPLQHGLHRVEQIMQDVMQQQVGTLQCPCNQ